MFFGRIVRQGKSQPLVPHQDGFSLHLSQVSLPASIKEGTRVSLLIKVGDDEPVVLCTLRAGSQDTVLLDQFVDEYAELSVEGSCAVHVTGYFSPHFTGAEDDDEEDEDEDDEYGVHPLRNVFGDGSDDEMESDDEDETDDMDSDGYLAAQPQEPSVIIEDITDKDQQEQNAVAAHTEDTKKRKAHPSGEQAAAKKQAVKPAEQKPQGKQQQQQQKEQQQQPTEPKSEQKQAAKEKQQAKKDQQQKAKQKEQQQTAKTPEKKSGAGETAAQPLSSKKGVRRYENGFEVHNVKMGDPHGKLAKGGKQVKVKYVGKLTNGKVFDKSDKKPFTFRLGVGEVIKGWDAGVEGMRVGDVRKLIIPPQMGYGSQRTGPIPPNSVLEFQVELVDVK